MNEEIKFTENGVVIVKTLTVTGEPMPEVSEEKLLEAYKETILYALNKRAKHCMDDLQANTNDIRFKTCVSVGYVRADKTFNVFNNNTYEAMLEAIQLTKEDKFNEFTALQWGQLLKALVWVKPTNAGGYTFAQFFSYVHEMGLEKSIELYNKK